MDAWWCRVSLLAMLALLLASAADADIVFPKPAATQNAARCPYPLPEGATLSSLPAGCYHVTDEEDEFVVLTAAHSGCSRNYVLAADGRCLKVVRLAQPNRKKPPKGTPSW